MVDTSAWVAYYNTKDVNHENAVKIIDDIKKGLFKLKKLYTTDYIFAETIIMILRSTKRPEIAEMVGEVILNSKYVEVLKVTENDIKEAWKFFKKHKHRFYSFTDCTTFVLMKRYGIKRAFTFDEHFREAGFELAGE